MRILLIVFVLLTLCGCESLSEFVREKKYNVKVYETPTSKQTLGYNDDYDYVGYMIEGKFR